VERPTSVTVFGVLNIVFGAIGLLSLPMSLATLSGKMPGAMGALTQDPTWRAYMTVGLVVGPIMCIVLIAAGIGLLKLLKWARLVSIYYAIVAIVWGIVGVAFTLVYVVPKITGSMSGPAATGGAIGGLAGGVIGMVYPILLIVFMLRPHVVMAFESGPGPLPGDTM